MVASLHLGLVRLVGTMLLVPHVFALVLSLELVQMLFWISIGRCLSVHCSFVALHCSCLVAVYDPSLPFLVIYPVAAAALSTWLEGFCLPFLFAPAGSDIFHSRSRLPPTACWHSTLVG